MITQVPPRSFDPRHLLVMLSLLAFCAGFWAGIWFFVTFFKC